MLNQTDRVLNDLSDGSVGRHSACPNDEDKVHSIIGKHVKDDILPLVDDHCQRIAVEVGRHLDSLEEKFKKGMRYMLQEIDDLKTRLPRVDSVRPMWMVQLLMPSRRIKPIRILHALSSCKWRH